MASDNPSLDDLEKYDQEENMDAAKRRAHEHIVEANIQLQRAANELAGRGVAPGLAHAVFPDMVGAITKVREDVEVLQSSLSTARVNAANYYNDDLQEIQERGER